MTATRSLVCAWLSLAVLWASAAPLGAQGAPRSGSFEALWTLKGSEHELDFGKGRQVATFRHTGTVTFRNAEGLVGTALASCLGMVDTDTGGQGRCVWALDGGERIFSTVNGALIPEGAESGTAKGIFVGGTGRFATISGEYEFDWVAQPVAEPGGFRMQTVRMSGVWEAP